VIVYLIKNIRLDWKERERTCSYRDRAHFSSLEFEIGPERETGHMQAVHALP